MSRVVTASGQSQAPFPDPIPGIIPFGTVTLFGGAPGAGKTTMLLDWCQRWQDGRTIWGKPTNKPNGIYYLAADRSWESYQRLITHLGVTPELHALSVADLYGSDVDLQSLLKDPKHGHEAFLYCYKKLQVPRGALLIVEPFALFIQGDLNKMRDVIISLLRLGALARKDGITIIATMHFGKQRQDGAYVRHQDKIAGSTAFAGYSDTQVVLVPPSGPKEPWYTLGWNPRDQEGEEFKVARGERGLFIPYAAKLGENELRVLSLIPLIPESISRAKIAELAEDAGTPIHRASLDRALNTLVQCERIARTEKGMYTRLPIH